jgi:UDPglucose--hexose-1-phosphate uridylyltransferase
MTAMPDATLLSSQPHRRLNALTGDWVFVSPHRHQRPWQGQREPIAEDVRPAYDPDCYLCPGNLRAGGVRNPDYTTTFVFDNDFPAFTERAAGGGAGSPAAANDRSDASPAGASSLLVSRPHEGTCRVICYSPRHDLSLAGLSPAQLLGVIECWRAQEAELRRRWRWVQLFENRGELMGSSNPHPHGQVWAGDFIPNEVARELAGQRRWLEAHATPLLLDYARLELRLGERVVLHDAHWLVVVPWWAVWPFETLVMPLRPVPSLEDLCSPEREALAAILGRLLRLYDRLFGVPFPYSFGWHGSPGRGSDPGESSGCQLHAHFHPPLLRSATVRKFMVGYELLAEFQRDLTAESAAGLLRECRAAEAAGT